jgi:hypothetical protein
LVTAHLAVQTGSIDPMHHHLLPGIALGLALAGLVGCASPEELGREDKANCAGYGYQANTADFDACVTRESVARQEYQQVDRHLGWVPVFGTGGM